VEPEKAAIETYDWLISRACEITSDAPYWSSVYNEQYARISIDGETAKIVWPEAESDYGDSCTIGHNAVSFPARLLLMSDAELAAWKVEQRAIYDRQKAEQAARNAREREAHERAVFEALKAKFETQK
jgi:hypothetical protein